MIRCFVLIWGMLCPLPGLAVTVQPILDPQPVHEADLNSFVSPLAWDGVHLYSASVLAAEGAATGTNLRTVVRQGSPDSSGAWRWQQTVVDARTHDDKWHNAPSVGVDRQGHLHVAYNMHNMPWQYLVSVRPRDATRFIFRGQRITQAQQDQVQHRNRVDFSGFGNAAIPGNQITYPVFFNDPTGRMYVTYRYTLRPKRRWAQRGLAGGLAVYEEGTRSWRQLGGEVQIKAEDADFPPGQRRGVTRPLIHEPGWTLSPLQLAFDHRGGMHLVWLWREGGPGREFVQPSYAYSPDGGRSFYRSDGSRYRLPIGRKDAEKLVADEKGRFLNTSPLSVNRQGNPSVLLHPVDRGRTVLISRSKGQWQASGDAPFSAQALHFDAENRLWLFASGLQVLRREQGSWRHLVRDQGGQCHPRILPLERQIFVFMRGCKDSSVSIWKVSFD